MTCVGLACLEQNMAIVLQYMIAGISCIPIIVMSYALIVQMVWAERAQNASNHARRAKNWLLGKPGLVLAVVMLIIAMILHRLGYIGS